jgi:predicted ester cyclase
MPFISDSRRAARIQAVHEHFRIENTHDLDAVMDTFGTQASLLANNVRHEGRDAVRAFYGEFFRGFPDLRFEITHVHAGGEAIPVELVLSGTHTGTWFGMPPPGVASSCRRMPSSSSMRTTRLRVSAATSTRPSCCASSVCCRRREPTWTSTFCK